MRRRLFDWRSPAAGVLAGRTVLVTGPTSGIGLATTRDLARLGARVVLLGRDRTKLEDLAAELRDATGEDRFPIVVADMSLLSSVRAAVAHVSASEQNLDVIVDNAGAIYPERALTSEGIERTLAVLAVGPFVLIDGLLPMLQRSADGRVIHVTTGGMYLQPVHLRDLELARSDYEPARAYAHAKRVQVALMREWARRRRGSGVSFNAMHPGWADTPGLAESLPGFYRLMKPLLRSPEEAADTIVWLATSGDVAAPGGLLYLDRRPRPFDRIPQTRLTADDRADLWEAIRGLAQSGGGIERRSAR